MEEESDWEGGDSRQEMFNAPGWDDIEYGPCDVIGINSTKSYSAVTALQLNTLTPVPSQRLDTTYYERILPITLDLCATLSFIIVN